MRALVRSTLSPSQRNAQSTFGQNRALVQSQRLEKLGAERRKMVAAQVGADAGLTPVFKQRGAMIERQIGRLQVKNNSDSTM